MQHRKIKLMHVRMADEVTNSNLVQALFFIALLVELDTFSKSK